MSDLTGKYPAYDGRYKLWEREDGKLFLSRNDGKLDGITGEVPSVEFGLQRVALGCTKGVDYYPYIPVPLKSPINEVVIHEYT